MSIHSMKYTTRNRVCKHALVLQRTFIPVDCTARSGACDERHRRRGSAVASRPRGQGLPVCQRYAWAESRAIAPAPAGWFTPALFFSPEAHPHQQEVSQHTERHMMLPPAPPAHFIIAHAQGLLAIFETRLDQ